MDSHKNCQEYFTHKYTLPCQFIEIFTKKFNLYLTLKQNFFRILNFFIMYPFLKQKQIKISKYFTEKIKNISSRPKKSPPYLFLLWRYVNKL